MFITTQRIIFLLIVFKYLIQLRPISTDTSACQFQMEIPDVFIPNWIGICSLYGFGTNLGHYRLENTVWIITNFWMQLGRFWNVQISYQNLFSGMHLARSSEGVQTVLVCVWYDFSSVRPEIFLPSVGTLVSGILA